jgi:hypothetical protein
MPRKCIVTDYFYALPFVRPWPARAPQGPKGRQSGRSSIVVSLRPLRDEGGYYEINLNASGLEPLAFSLKGRHSTNRVLRPNNMSFFMYLSAITMQAHIKVYVCLPLERHT